jgi:hypothetical protein
MSHLAQDASQVSSNVPAEPVPVAFLSRTSTLLLQDPAASLRRQAREVQEKLPPGWFISAWFWDIESGGLDIEQRGHGTAHQAVDVGLPRDGGLAAVTDSSSDSANWKPSAPRLTTGWPPWTGLLARRTNRACWTRCPCSAMPCPGSLSASRPGCSKRSAWR